MNSDIVLVGSEATAVPDWFKRRLRDIDPALTCYWNPFHGQFTINRCGRGNECTHSDPHNCQWTHVMFFPHIGERAIEKLKGMDTWTQTNASGGNDEAALLKFRRGHEIAKEEFDAKRKDKAKAAYKEAMLDNRKQINEVLDTLKNQDIARW